MADLSLTTEQTAIELAADIAAGKLSAVEATDAAIARIEATDGEINAVVVRDFERAREAAKLLDQKGKQAGQSLFGVPMTVKESLDVAGLVSCWGLEEARENRANRDSAVVRRLKRAGAVILGKTNVPPALSDWQSNNPVYGRTNNPHDKARVPGGSSGGGAAAVASGMVPVEYGSDIGGSIRVPAHYCGIWGHKPTYGVVSGEGQSYPGTQTHDVALAVVGPLARSADDLALVFEATLDHPLTKPEVSLKGSRFLLLSQQPMIGCDDDYRERLESLATQLEQAGATVDRDSDLLPDLVQQNAYYLKMLTIAMMGGLDDGAGNAPSTRDWFDLLDAQALNQRAWHRFFDQYDYVLAPPACGPAFLHSDVDPAERMLDVAGQPLPFHAQLPWAGIASFPSLPATTLPIGKIDHLPVGVQVMGDQYTDFSTISISKKISQLLA